MQSRVGKYISWDEVRLKLDLDLNHGAFETVES